MSGTISKDLGGFQVMVAETDVKAFSAALGFPPDCLEVPLTYPMRMLADPMIASAIREALPDEGAIIHQAQRFVSHCTRSLKSGSRPGLSRISGDSGCT